MKRIVVLLLCLCMVLPMVFAMAFSAGATTDPVDAKPVISLDKTVYYPGEDIKITASYKNEGCWIGIVPADEEGEPITTYGTIYWLSVPAEGLNAVSLMGQNAIQGNNAKNLAIEMGFTEAKGYTPEEAVAEMLTLPTGKYFAAHIDSADGIYKAYKENPENITFVPFTITQFTMDKTTFLYGEAIPVNVVYTNATSGYIGLSHVKDNGTEGQNLYYTYIKDVPSTNNVIDISKGTLYGADAEKYGRLPAGRYVVYFVPTNNGGVTSRDQRTDVYIDILGATVEKTEFKYGEPIMVKGYGEGKDWVGIAALDETTETGLWSNGSIRWRYIEPVEGKSEVETGFGSGVAFDIRESKLAGAATARGDLPVGDYVIMVGLDDCYAYDVSPYTFIPITITADAPAAPAEVKYDLTDERTGLAGGKLTVTFNEADMEAYKKPTKVELYWADENGNALEGYNKIGSRKITGATTVIDMTASMVIPEGAKKLMVHAYNGAGYAAEAVAVDLPTTRGYRTTGEKITSFQIVSDMHIGRSNTDGDGVNMSDKHAQLMFADIATIDPDSVGIFVAGDAADHGQETEYQQLFDLWEASGLDAKLYIGVGNHEMMKDTSGHNYNSQENYSVQSGRFLEYANLSLEEAEKTTTPYYYVERGGQHFIFLATEYCGTHAYLSDAQLEWLEAKLGEVAADGAPVFIMLHQPLYNTVAGGLANEDGSKRQGWHGVIAGNANFELWKTESGGALSDHGKMYGQYEAPLREILAQYPSAMMFSGHSHWIMESLGNIYEATEAQPNYMFNTASVSYLWTDNDELNGGTGTPEGSQGYFVTVYENCIEFRGRDFLNGTWIPNAYYRVWLDCAHEGEVLCDTTCKWCGETNTNAIPHDGEKDCDTTCKYCGVANTVTDAVAHDGEKDCDTTCKYCGVANTVTDAVAHDGEKDCDTTCKYCGVANTVTDAVDCSGKFDCSTKCQYCGEAVEPRIGTHTFTYVCDETCAECGEEIAHEEHDGLYDCSDKCQWCGIDVDHKEHVGANGCETVCMYGCGTAVQGTGHEREFDCSVVCKNCRADITEGAAAHAGVADCATICMYGCGTAVTPDPEATHAGEFACSETCAECGEAIEPAQSHAGAFDCSDKCASCNAEITPKAEHVNSEVLCSGLCTICGERVFIPDAHKGAEACSTVCKYGCGSIVEPTAPHTGAFECSELCTVCTETFIPDVAHAGELDCSAVCATCGTAIKGADHVGELKCSVVCKYGCGTAVKGAAHEGAANCALVCKYGCGTAVEGTGEHVKTYKCSETCVNCGTPVSHAAHVGINDCATKCKYCDIDITPKSSTHKYDNACDDTCNNCNEKRTVTSAHRYDHSCDVDCNVCGFERTVNDHVYAGACDTDCQICGATREPGNHTFGDWYVAVEPTETTAGEERRLCSVCGAVEKAELPVKAVTGDLNNEGDEKINVALIGEVDKDVFLIVVIAAAVVVVAVVAAICIGVVKKKKKATNAEEATEASAEEAPAAETTDAPAEEASEESAEEPAEEEPSDEKKDEE